ncbi:MAG: hypothetical protein ACD_46C00358G0001 [uncultured bacterium]|nr:MAG: hypothetical protein ACD_46C00358G0001 [uncultured bacterium]
MQKMNLIFSICCGLMISSLANADTTTTTTTVTPPPSNQPQMMQAQPPQSQGAPNQMPPPSNQPQMMQNQPPIQPQAAPGQMVKPPSNQQMMQGQAPVTNGSASNIVDVNGNLKFGTPQQGSSVKSNQPTSEPVIITPPTDSTSVNQAPIAGTPPQANIQSNTSETQEESPQPQAPPTQSTDGITTAPATKY